MKKKNFKKLFGFTRLVKPLFGFTLAEVLITLSILGVVAAITVPSLIKRQHRNEVETKIRKMYSTISTALDQAEANEGKGFASWGVNDDNTMATKYFLPYMNIQKNCMTDGDCPSYTSYYQDAKTVLGTFTPKFILKDGIYLRIDNKGAGGNDYGDFWAVFDINGPKGPNAYGRDIFIIITYVDNKTGSYYFGSAGWNAKSKDKNGIANSCKNESNRGAGYQYCMGWIYANGIKIPKDYPYL